ncbi:DUF1488 family protein [Muricoccus pecuniae]|uniref:DUF1488 domain-containing protein n=1 Tax=Muricoccus pecuniae TaxID=693023 RepID=A0A840YIC1_9PROT|nr:DUF1488 family protein [Roseomonas pecuniae]MBB5694322.1 hypothetical protein [Roseomonas pecuniae]
MTEAGKIILAAPRSGQGCVLFEVENQGEAVACSVSRAAIQDASGCRTGLPGALLAQFVHMQDRIMLAALQKLRSRSAVTGVLHIWSSDLEEEPMAPVQAAAPGVPS